MRLKLFFTLLFICYCNIANAQYNSQHLMDTTTFLQGNIVMNIVAADISGDGLKDVVIHRYQDEVLWYENLGDLNFGAAQLIANDIPRPFFIDATDVNGDGKEDIIISNNNGTISSIEFFNSNGFTKTTIDSNIFAAENVLFADFDNDGDKDIVACNDLMITLYLNDGTGNFGDRIVLLSGMEYYNMSIGNFNNDAFPDLALLSSEGSQIYMNDTNDGLDTPITLSFQLSAFVTHSNLDNSNTDEIFFQSLAPTFFDIYHNDGSNNFSIQQSVQFNQPNVQNAPLKIGKINSDNYNDAAFAVLGPNKGLYTKFNDGTGQFMESVNLLDDSSTYYQVELADLDNDGDNELLFFRNTSVVASETELGFYVNDNMVVSTNTPPIPDKLLVYPNPTNGQINIASDVFFDEIHLHSIDGKLLSVNKQFPVSLNLFPNGLYILTTRTKNENTHTSKPIIITKK